MVDERDPDDVNFVNMKNITTVVGGVVIMMFCGSFFLWANISVYVLSYLHWKSVQAGGRFPDVGVNVIYYVDLALILLNVTGYNVGTYLF